jgi:hypothetical protein
MREDERHLRGLPGIVLDLDLTPEGGWVALIGSRDGNPVPDQRLIIDGREHPVPCLCRFPLLRALGESGAVLVEARSRAGPNAWVVDREGVLRASFRAGDGIHEVLATDTTVVITYFDEGVFACDGGPNRHGLSVFSAMGELAFGYNQRFQGQGHEIADCYCACWEGPESLVFFPYTDFPLIRLDLARVTQEAVPTPERVHGASALTTAGDQVFFYNPYDDRDAILRWTRGAPEVELAESYPGRLRGLAGGRFLGVGTAGYTIVSVTD